MPNLAQIAGIDLHGVEQAISISNGGGDSQILDDEEFTSWFFNTPVAKLEHYEFELSPDGCEIEFWEV